MMKRYVVYVPAVNDEQKEGFVLQRKWPRWRPRRTLYDTSPDPQAARVFYREADAKRVAKETKGGVVPVMLWYGPYAPHEREWKP